MTDASPLGLGGYVTVQGQIFQWFSEPLTAGDAERFRLELGAPDCQCTWEALALLLAVSLWAKHARGGKAVLRVRSDNVATLQLSTKLASASWRLNAIGAELGRLLRRA